ALDRVSRRVAGAAFGPARVAAVSEAGFEVGVQCVVPGARAHHGRVVAVAWRLRARAARAAAGGEERGGAGGDDHSADVFHLLLRCARSWPTPETTRRWDSPPPAGTR